MVLTEEPTQNTFAAALTGRISREFFSKLDAPVSLIGSKNVPAIPVCQKLEEYMLPSEESVAIAIEELLSW